MVLVKMNVFFHRKVDRPEVLSAGSQTKKINFVVRFLIHDMDQKSLLCKHK